MKHLIPFLLIVNVAFGQQWTETKLNDFVSIEFPIAPEREEDNGDLYYSALDEGGVYLVTIKQMSGLKPNGLREANFYDDFISGVLASVNAKLLEKRSFTENGIEGVEISYLANSNPQLPDLRCKRILAVEGHVVSYEFWTYLENEKLTTTNKDHFFTSISLSLDQIKTSNAEQNQAYNIGFLIGRIIFLLVAGAIVVLVIRYFERKRNKI